ncbi:hypothetical protein TWF481_009718 [Arthrobotrys musiformis]|uniref:Uncharacterized protein n=1 Tax=Arthrobotrys musiformis TaxID=47236 RepID=A0AAV9W4M8_9PEZI
MSRSAEMSNVAFNRECDCLPIEIAPPDERECLSARGESDFRHSGDTGVQESGADDSQNEDLVAGLALTRTIVIRKLSKTFWTEEWSSKPFLTTTVLGRPMRLAILSSEAGQM